MIRVICETLRVCKRLPGGRRSRADHRVNAKAVPLARAYARTCLKTRNEPSRPRARIALETHWRPA